MPHVISSFLTRCQTRAPALGAQSQPLGHQGILLTARGTRFYPGDVYLHWTLTGFSSEEEISSDDEELVEEEKKKPQRRGPAKRKLEVEEYPSFMAKRFADFTVYRNRTLQKWHDKTKLASGKLGKASVGACVCV